MAATLTETDRIQLGQSKVLVFGTVALDSSYPTGGEAIDPTGTGDYDVMLIEPMGGVTLEWDKANVKVKAYWGNAGTASLLPEVTATTDLSAVVAQFMAIATT